MDYYPTIQATDDGFVATFKDIPEAITQGSTHRELMENAYDALLTALEFYFEDVRKIPPPTKLSDLSSTYTFHVRLPLSVELRVIFLNEYVTRIKRDSEFTLFGKEHYHHDDVADLFNLHKPLDMVFYEKAIRQLDRRIKVNVGFR